MEKLKIGQKIIIKDRFDPYYNETGKVESFSTDLWCGAGSKHHVIIKMDKGSELGKYECYRIKHIEPLKK